MRSVAIVVVGELGQDHPQVSFVDHDQVVEAFGPNGPHDPLGHSVRVRRAWRGPHPADAQTRQLPVELTAVDGIPVVDEVFRLAAPGRRLQELVPEPAVGLAVTLKWSSSRRWWRMMKKT